MMMGQKPDPVHARMMDVAMILYADHAMNASTFAATVAASTLADLYSTIVAAISTLKGPLHGGAIDDIERWTRAKLAIPGRVLRDITCDGCHHGQHVAYRYRAEAQS